MFSNNMLSDLIDPDASTYPFNLDNIYPSKTVTSTRTLEAQESRDNYAVPVEVKLQAHYPMLDICMFPNYFYG